MNSKSGPSSFTMEEMNPRTTNFPSLEKLTKVTHDIIELLEDLQNPRIINLKETNENDFNNYIQEKHSHLYIEYYSTFRQIVDPISIEERNNNVGRIFNMIKQLKETHVGRFNKETVINKLEEEIAQEYFYPAFGGKQNTIKKLQKMALEKEKQNKKK
jgi:hypothetical protein